MIPKPGTRKAFVPAPAGTKPCTLIDFIEMQDVETKFGVKDMIRFLPSRKHA